MHNFFFFYKIPQASRSDEKYKWSHYALAIFASIPVQIACDRLKHNQHSIVLSESVGLVQLSYEQNILDMLKFIKQ